MRKSLVSRQKRIISVLTILLTLALHGCETILNDAARAIAGFIITLVVAVVLMVINFLRGKSEK